jgi:hypothetical protein
VASSSTGRPTIKDVFEEMDKALRNTTIKVRISTSIPHIVLNHITIVNQFWMNKFNSKIEK